MWKVKEDEKLSNPITMFFMWQVPLRWFVTWKLWHCILHTGVASFISLPFWLWTFILGKFFLRAERESRKIKSNNRPAGGWLGQAQSRREVCDPAATGGELAYLQRKSHLVVKHAVTLLLLTLIYNIMSLTYVYHEIILWTSEFFILSARSWSVCP